jgi:PAS domain S-box-containing protein
LDRSVACPDGYQAKLQGTSLVCFQEWCAGYGLVSHGKRPASGDLLEAAAYRRLLLRLVLLPLVALGLLALTVAYGFRQVERSARRVDHSDRVIAHAHNLVRLMVDEETGLRGFLLSHDATFLEPYQKATQKLDPEFSDLFSLVRHDPEQTARLQRLQATSRVWQQEARQTIAQPGLATELHPKMLERKRQMDALRASADDFISAEASIRASRSFTALHVDQVSLYGLIGLAVLLGVLLAWEIRRLFQKLAAAYSLQMEEVKRRGDESFAREQWLNTTLRSIGDAVIACDPEGNVVFMNGVAEQLTGWRESEANGRPLSEIFVIQNQRTRAAVENPVEAVRRSGKIVGLANHTILIDKDLKEFQIDDSAAPILDANSVMIGIVMVFRDITERHAAELALMRAEKLASAGRLAAAIAHEVNNPLEGLVNLIYLARSEQSIEKIRRHLVEADRELQRIAHITRQSLGFYREPSSAGLFRPDVVAREVFEFYSSRAASARVSLHVKLTTEQQVYGNSGELRQVLSNLLANSLDACREGDEVCVRVRAGRRGSAAPGVCITLADSGSGIRPENLKRIFEPFYTTKKDTGTGLGLWVSRELIEKCGGRLNVRSSVAEGRSGTVFTVFLPAAAQGALHEPSGPLQRLKIG